MLRKERKPATSYVLALQDGWLPASLTGLLIGEAVGVPILLLIEWATFGISSIVFLVGATTFSMAAIGCLGLQIPLVLVLARKWGKDTLAWFVALGVLANGLFGAVGTLLLFQDYFGRVIAIHWVSVVVVHAVVGAAVGIAQYRLSRELSGA